MSASSWFLGSWTMRDIRADLRERLAATVKQRIELEARERCLRALLQDEELSQPLQLQQACRPDSSEAIDGPRLRKFVLGSLEDGHEWSLEALKEQACGVGLTRGAPGRTLNITLVNLLRKGLVMRLPDGKWRLRDQSTQLRLDLASPSPNPDRDDRKARAQLAS
jgi:hypothetical protein